MRGEGGLFCDSATSMLNSLNSTIILSTDKVQTGWHRHSGGRDRGVGVTGGSIMRRRNNRRRRRRELFQTLMQGKGYRTTGDVHGQ